MTSIETNTPPPVSNTFGALSLLVMFLGEPALMLYASSIKGWDGLAVLILGVPAVAAVAIVLALIANLRSEPYGWLAMTLTIVLPMLVVGIAVR